MAVEAAVGRSQGLVGEPDALGLICDILVTFKAEFVSRFQKNGPVFRTMGIMALIAFALGDNRVDTLILFR